MTYCTPRWWLKFSIQNSSHYESALLSQVAIPTMYFLLTWHAVASCLIYCLLPPSNYLILCTQIIAGSITVMNEDTIVIVTSSYSLVFRFGISESSACWTFSKWRETMDIQLSFLILWPDRDSIQKTMPFCFRQNYWTECDVHHWTFYWEAISVAGCLCPFLGALNEMSAGLETQ